MKPAATTHSSEKMLVAAVGRVAMEAGLHTLAGKVALRLFHPPGPIPDGEFFAGITIQARR